MKNIFRAGLSLLAFLSIQAHAGNIAVTVTPGDLLTAGGSSIWYFLAVNNAKTGAAGSAAITGANPYGGNGSIALSSTSAKGQAALATYWGFEPGRTLGNLSALSFDWYRNGSSTAAPQFAPAVRIFVDADGDPGTRNDESILVWEQFYNGATPTDQWVSSDIMNQSLWQWVYSPGYAVGNFDKLTLADWIGGAQPDGAVKLNSGSAVLGLQFGVGPGWDNTFVGNVDNVRFGFGGDSTTYNFELAANPVPEPGSLALLGIGVLGVRRSRRRPAGAVNVAASAGRSGSRR